MMSLFKKGVACFISATLFLGVGQPIVYASEATYGASSKVDVLADAVYADVALLEDSVVFLENGKFSSYEGQDISAYEDFKNYVSTDTNVIFMDENGKTNSYYIVDIETGKEIKTKYYISTGDDFDGEYYLGRKGEKSVIAGLDGSIYIDDIGSYIEKIAKKEKIKKQGDSYYGIMDYKNGTLAIYVYDLNTSNKQYYTYLFTKESDFKFDKAKKIKGSIRYWSADMEYFVTCSNDGYLSNFCKRDGTIVKNFENSKDKYYGSFYATTVKTEDSGDFTIYDRMEPFLYASVYDKVGTCKGIAIVSKDGKVSEVYKKLWISGTFLFGETDKNVCVITEDNKVVYTEPYVKGDNFGIRTDGLSYKQCFVIGMYGDNCRLYDRNGNCFWGENDNYYAIGNSNTSLDYNVNEDVLENGITLIEKKGNSAWTGKYGAIKISDLKTTTTNIEKAKVTLSKGSYNYDGKTKKPSVTVKFNGKNLIKDTDYTVTYKNNQNIGTATITITGKGNYTGTLKKTFIIKAKKGTTFTSGKYKYKVTDEATVAFNGIKSNTTTKVSIPKTVKYGGKSFKVTSIADGALKKKTKVTQVTIGANVKTVGVSAFEGCKKLSKVSIGKAVTTIEDKAFKKCTALKSISIPSKVTKIDKQAFYGCKNLKTITIKSTKLKTVGKDALKGINSKATIKVPKSKLSAYKKLLKDKGQGSKVKIVKSK